MKTPTRTMKQIADHVVAYNKLTPEQIVELINELNDIYKESI